MQYRYFKRDNGTLWHNMPLVYKVTHDGGEFLLTSENRLDYKSTIKLLQENGYKSPYITYIGHDVTI